MGVKCINGRIRERLRHVICHKRAEKPEATTRVVRRCLTVAALPSLPTSRPPSRRNVGRPGGYPQRLFHHRGRPRLHVCAVPRPVAPELLATPVHYSIKISLNGRPPSILPFFRTVATVFGTHYPCYPGLHYTVLHRTFLLIIAVKILLYSVSLQALFDDFMNIRPNKVVQYCTSEGFPSLRRKCLNPLSLFIIRAGFLPMIVNPDHMCTLSLRVTEADSRRRLRTISKGPPPSSSGTPTRRSFHYTVCNG